MSAVTAGIRKSARRLKWEQQCAVDGVCPDCRKPNDGPVHLCRAKDRITMKHLGDVEVRKPKPAPSGGKK